MISFPSWPCLLFGRGGSDEQCDGEGEWYGGTSGTTKSRMNTPCDYIIACARRVDKLSWAKKATLVFEQQDPFIDFLLGVKIQYPKRNATNLLINGILQSWVDLLGVWI